MEVKTYRAPSNGTNVIVHEHGHVQRNLKPRRDLRHYANGFEWGKLSRGCKQLSLALLCDALGDDERALDLYEQYATDVIAKLPSGVGIVLTDSTIRIDARLMERRKEPKQLLPSFYAPAKGRDFVEFPPGEDFDATIQRVIGKRA